jgi:hypothetical protein
MADGAHFADQLHDILQLSAIRVGIRFELEELLGINSARIEHRTAGLEIKANRPIFCEPHVRSG